MPASNDQLSFGMLASFVVMWVLLLLPAVMVRYVVVRAPLSEAAAAWIGLVATLLVAGGLILVGGGSPNVFALFFAWGISFGIMRRGHRNREDH